VVALGDEAAVERLRPTLAAVPQVLWVHSKIDLATDVAEARIDATPAWLPVSARSGAGLAALIEALKRAAGLGDGSEGAFSARARHVDALRRVASALGDARAHLQQRAGELCAEELKLAQRALDELTGEFRSDELLGRIFSSFCIGK
jgi:tRNA modification GTPase